MCYIEIERILERWRKMSLAERAAVFCAMPIVAAVAILVGPGMFIFWGLEKAVELLGVMGKNDWSGDPWSLM